MNKYRLLLSGCLFFLSLGLLATDCPFIYGLSANESLPAPCCTTHVYARIQNNSFITMNFTATYAFGDGTTLVNNYTGFTPGSDDFPEMIHTYALAGLYTITLTLTGPNLCVSTKTTTILVTNYCETACGTYSVLSTGYNRTTNLPYPSSFGTSGTPDPNWTVVQRCDLIAPTFTPDPATIVNYTGFSAYDIFPNIGYCGPTTAPLGNSRYISLSPGYSSIYGTPNIYTYRTLFTLPTPIPAGQPYSLAMSMRADDAIYQVKLNGNNLKSPVFSQGYSYSGPPYILYAGSCGPNTFVAGTNTLDIVVADNPTGVTQLDAEIVLYSCPGQGPCPPPLGCSDCISSFAPNPGKKYLLSAWTKEDNAPQSKTSYTYPSIDVQFPSIGGSVGPFTASGNIIDGWQRIEAEFFIPNTATDITVQLNCSSNDCFFDDIRILPFDGSMKSYVYDPVNMRLVAELDERNYATLYEYDEEGKLTRVKKETEKGKMTIKENRENIKK